MVEDTHGVLWPTAVWVGQRVHAWNDSKITCPLSDHLSTGLCIFSSWGPTARPPEFLRLCLQMPSALFGMSFSSHSLFSAFRDLSRGLHCSCIMCSCCQSREKTASHGQVKLSLQQFLRCGKIIPATTEPKECLHGRWSGGHVNPYRQGSKISAGSRPILWSWGSKRLCLGLSLWLRW